MVHFDLLVSRWSAKLIMFKKNCSAAHFFRTTFDLGLPIIPSFARSKMGKLHISALFSHISAFMIFNIFSHISATKKDIFPYLCVVFPRHKILCLNSRLHDCICSLLLSQACNANCRKTRWARLPASAAGRTCCNANRKRMLGKAAGLGPARLNTDLGKIILKVILDQIKFIAKKTI
jgi:hypothetical protein